MFFSPSEILYGVNKVGWLSLGSIKANNLLKNYYRVLKWESRDQDSRLLVWFFWISFFIWKTRELDWGDPTLTEMLKESYLLSSFSKFSTFCICFIILFLSLCMCEVKVTQSSLTLTTPWTMPMEFSRPENWSG